MAPYATLLESACIITAFYTYLQFFMMCITVFLFLRDSFGEATETQSCIRAWLPCYALSAKHYLVSTYLITYFHKIKQVYYSRFLDIVITDLFRIKSSKLIIDSEATKRHAYNFLVHYFQPNILSIILKVHEKELYYQA